LNKRIQNNLTDERESPQEAKHALETAVLKYDVILLEHIIVIYSNPSV